VRALCEGVDRAREDIDQQFDEELRDHTPTGGDGGEWYLNPIRQLNVRLGSV
jgi:hypothetical protein